MAGTREWLEVAEEVGRAVARFQELTDQVDTTAAAILAVDRRDLPCLTLLLFAGPLPARGIAQALGLPRPVLRDVIARLELAGFVRRQPGPALRLEVTEHAREWIARLWEPLRTRGLDLLARFSAPELERLLEFLRLACRLQEQHVATLQPLLREPGGTRPGHRRGGLSPAALRNVQVFVDAHLQHRVRVADLAARARLSVSHFTRAFRVSTGSTPHAFIESRRITRARTLIQGTDRSLAEIALVTGFTSQSRLTTAFRRATGFTPAVYRRGRRP